MEVSGNKKNGKDLIEEAEIRTQAAPVEGPEDMEDDSPEDAQDMDLGELDLDAIEKEYDKEGKGYVSR